MARPRNGSTQPTRVVTGQGYGEAQADARLQQARPLPAPSAPGEVSPNLPSASPGAATPSPTPEGSPPTPFIPPSQPPNVFGPSTAAPVEPLLPSNQFGVLTALYQRFPNNDLRRLIERAAYYASIPPPQ